MTIRWPFVSRSLYALACIERDAARQAGQQYSDWLRADLARAEARYDALAERYHALANPAATMTTPAGVIPLERAEPSEITKVIREQCETADGRTDHALARHLRAYAKQLKRAGKSDDEIVSALVHWQSSEPATHVAEAVN